MLASGFHFGFGCDGLEQRSTHPFVAKCTGIQDLTKYNHELLRLISDLREKWGPRYLPHGIITVIDNDRGCLCKLIYIIFWHTRSLNAGV